MICSDSAVSQMMMVHQQLQQVQREVRLLPLPVGQVRQRLCHQDPLMPIRGSTVTRFPQDHRGRVLMAGHCLPMQRQRRMDAFIPLDRLVHMRQVVLVGHQSHVLPRPRPMDTFFPLHRLLAPMGPRPTLCPHQRSKRPERPRLDTRHQCQVLPGPWGQRRPARTNSTSGHPAHIGVGLGNGSGSPMNVHAANGQMTMPLAYVNVPHVLQQQPNTGGFRVNVSIEVVIRPLPPPREPDAEA
ncbi:unnamed protein product [Symbiodinium natans]|uniref:Uncharacterized protein n=1 Tax=Symbiodinium natans TaxID=878477 RepID=A0A812MS57_9DINO|nr:unnamed protein product [Symbiodinium natans]